MENFLWGLFWFVLGVLAQWFIGGSFWNTRFVKARRARKQQERLNKILSESRSKLVIGSLQIEQIMAQIFAPPIVSSDVTCHFEPQARSLPPDIQELEFNFLPKRVSQLKAQGKTVDFNDLYGLKSIRVERPQHEHGERRNRPVLVFEPTNFKYYLMANECLDTPLLPELTRDPVSIRQRHKLDLSDFHWSDMEKIPLHQWFATVTGVVTMENQLVIAIRSDMQAILEPASGDLWYRAALSCAEGMLRPTDSIVSSATAETPSPFKTVFRALQDELGLKLGEHYIETQVELLGMGFDKKRCQPVGIFFLELEKLGFADIMECWQTSKDKQENITLIPVALEPKSMSDLLLGRLSFREKPLRLFSNHQELGALFVGFYKLGVKPFGTVP